MFLFINKKQKHVLPKIKYLMLKNIVAEVINW